jgi:hypothetical protein
MFPGCSSLFNSLNNNLLVCFALGIKAVKVRADGGNSNDNV